MKIALAQINPTVGDIPGNAEVIRRDIRRAAELGAGLVVFPELAVIGYPPKDLLLKPAVIDDCAAAIEDLARHTADLPIAALIGYPCPSDDARHGLALYNAAALCRHGRIAHRHVKSLLPTYDVFDESRYFAPSPLVDPAAARLTELDGRRLGISICEDLWNDAEMFSRQLYHDNPIDRLAAAGADLFINCSASPFVVRKHAFRLRLMRHTARRHRLPLLYCNQVGGNDELVFDGNSCAFDAHGNLVAHGKAFEEDLVLVDTAAFDDPTPHPPVHPSAVLSPAQHDGSAPWHTVGPPAGEASGTDADPRGGDLSDVYRALVLGIRDYCRKCGFGSIVLGLSGGIDSALTAVLAADALGPERVHGVAMPSRYSSDHSVQDAGELADRLGLRFSVIPIAEPHRAMETLMAPHFVGRAPDSTEENIQARLRGVIMMALSNKTGALLVTTGNKSELAVGYCTLYGDMCGGLAAISDVPKTLVWKLSRWINTPGSDAHRRFGRAVIPERSISKVPSAELRPDQTDQDSLPPYDALDQIVERYVEREQSARQIIAECPHLDPQTVRRMVRLIDLNEYKRKQAAPGIKVTGRAFGFGRRMPIAQRYDGRR